MEKKFGSFYKAMVWSTSCAPRYISTWRENWHPHKNLHPNVYRNFITNVQKWEATMIFCIRRIDKQTRYILTKEYHSMIKKEMSYQTMERHGRILNERTKPVWNAKHCVIVVILHYEKGKNIEIPKSIVVARVWEARGNEYMKHRGF